MKSKLFIGIFILILSFFIFRIGKNYPIPTKYSIIHKENEHFKKNREKWIESMHKAAPGTDWRKMDTDYRQKVNRKKLQLRKKLKETYGYTFFDKHKENFRDVSGYWQEKGSNNLAGRMLTVFYDEQTDILYGASQGGNVWLGDLGGNWQNSINDYIQFNDIQMIYVSHFENTERIIVAQKNPAIIYYSDDRGITWEQYQNLPPSGQIIRCIVKNDTTMYVARNSGSTNYLYKANPQTDEFNQIAIYTAPANKFDIWTSQYFNVEGVFVLSANQLDFIDENDNVNTITSLMLPFANSAIQSTILKGSFSENYQYLYAFYRANGTGYCLQSTDGGNHWIYKGSIEDDYLIPFTKNSFACSPINPEMVYAGGMECFRSSNGGTTFTKVNNWWDYYDNPEEKLHADIPEIKPVIFQGMIEYDLISTDGGTFISSDNLQSVLNISLSGLRVSQYYSTYTNRNDLNYIYAGSQDQGLQISAGENDSLRDFIQIISGDYGHIVSGDAGESFWAVYPGFVIYYPNYQNPNLSRSWDFEGTNYLWMPPLMEDPDDPQSVYLGGGGFTGGSHLIHITYFGILQAQQSDYNFAGESISAMGYSSLNHNYRYVLTKNGKFFYSTDGGSNWQQTEQFSGPHSHYFYGSTIVTSNVDEETVYIGGSGYSNPAVYVSYDHGITFEPFCDSLPNTLVFQLAISQNDEYLFAATEVGPFAMKLSEEQSWHNIEGIEAPDQTYWTVDYLNEINTARFGTYGRGIWDFVIQDNSSSQNDVVSAHLSIKAYPNPFINTLKFKLDDYNDKSTKSLTLQIFNLKGQKVKSIKISSNEIEWNGTDSKGKKVATGVYLCKIKSKNKILAVKKVVKIK